MIINVSIEVHSSSLIGVRFKKIRLLLLFFLFRLHSISRLMAGTFILQLFLNCFLQLCSQLSIVFNIVVNVLEYIWKWFLLGIPSIILTVKGQ